MLWRVLEVDKTDRGNPMAFLFAEYPVEEMNYDDFSSDWNSSDIKKWLNDDFYYSFFSEEERGAIITCEYHYGDAEKVSDKTAASKVFLLSVDEATDSRYFADDEDRAIGEGWWLRSSYEDSEGDHRAARVIFDGEIFAHSLIGSAAYGRLVRPALKIDLSSSIFTSSSSKYEVLH